MRLKCLDHCPLKKKSVHPAKLPGLKQAQDSGWEDATEQPGKLTCLTRGIVGWRVPHSQVRLRLKPDVAWWKGFLRMMYPRTKPQRSVRTQ